MTFNALLRAPAYGNRRGAGARCPCSFRIGPFDFWGDFHKDRMTQILVFCEKNCCSNRFGCLHGRYAFQVATTRLPLGSLLFEVGQFIGVQRRALFLQQT
ncbi:hypothetical protein PJE062_4263 [Pseudovibrio sp. JE062]|nr:hypothetical protein PJE062_4263 [Pseudovibrio sp. JE062]